MYVIYSVSMCNVIYVIHASNIYIYPNYLYVDPAGLAQSVSFTCINKLVQYDLSINMDIYRAWSFV